MPAEGRQSVSSVRFDVFELDFRSRELRKHGKRIRLQEQPFQILVMLLEAHGGTVLRDEIRDQLWPRDTIVEFEHSINAAVQRLRAALRDSAVRPRFIETVARRGYRFICPVEGSSAESLVLTGPRVQSGAAAAGSIAVLPLVDLSGDRENEYFSDGLTEEIINKLARIPGLKVIARTSAFAFKGRQEDVRKIAKVLDVNYILEGSVRRVASRVRICAQLVNGVDGGRLWSDSYDRLISDIFAIHDEIAHAIAAALRGQFLPLAPQYTPRLEAYECVLKARYCVNSFTRESLGRSVCFYERAIALDPGFAAARSGLAMSLIFSVFPGLTPADTAMPLARQSAAEALKIEPNSAEAQAVLGTVAALYEYDWNQAEKRFRLAMLPEPVPQVVRSFYAAAYLLPTGQTRQAAAQCVRALEDDPLNFNVRFRYGAMLLASGDTTTGESELRAASEVHPNLYQPVYLLGLSQALRGLHSDALAAAEAAYSLAPWNHATTGLFAGELVRAGEAERGGKLLANLHPGQYGTPTGLLAYYLARSDMDAAAECAWNVFEQRDPRLMLPIALLRAGCEGVLQSSPRWSSLGRKLRIPFARKDK